MRSTGGCAHQAVAYGVRAAGWSTARVLSWTVPLGGAGEEEGIVGYELRALMADKVVLAAVTADLEQARIVPLWHEMALVPMTDALFDAVSDGSTAGALGFCFLPGGFERVLAAWSSTGPIAYVEAEYFGGVGTQRAAVWAQGALAFGPFASEPRERTSRQVSPVSRALRLLGVVADCGLDEFDSVGLQRHRRLVDWA
jgi:hypothetical protein